MKHSSYVYCPKCRKEYRAFMDDNAYMHCYVCKTPVIQQAGKNSMPDEDETEARPTVKPPKLFRGKFSILKAVLWVVASSIFYIVCSYSQQGADIRQWSPLSFELLAMGVICTGIWLAIVDFRI